MKIDLIITELETGGAEKCCFQLARFLRQSSYDARIISIGPLAVPPKDGILKQALQENVPVISLNASNIYQLPKAWLQLRKRIKSDPPDIAQSFMWHANVLAAASYPQFHIPLIGGGRVLDRNPSRIWSSKWAAQRMNRFVAVSTEVAQWAQDVEQISHDRLLTIPNGIDIDHWDNLTSTPIDSDILFQTLPLDTPVLLVVGRMNHQKGTDLLANSLEGLLGSLPDHHIVFLGDGPLRPLVEEQKKNTSIGDRIHCLGVSSDVKAWMERSRLLLLPSRYEGMPNVVLEAMASRLPVATFQVEGITDLLGRAGESVQVAAKDDWEQWISNVRQMTQCHEIRARLSEENRRRVESSFKLEILLKRYEGLYQEVDQECQKRS